MEYNKPKILFLVQLPPPVHGVGVINQIVIDNVFIKNDFRTEVVELKFSDSFSDIRKFNIKKIVKFFKVYADLKRKLGEFLPDIVYFSFMPIGTGFFRDAIFIRLIRQFNTKIIIHLNNRGINERAEKWYYRKLYRSIFRNISVVHVSEQLMHDEFQKFSLYNCKQFVINNTCEKVKSRTYSKNNEFINILFLSNIFPEKGVFIAMNAYYELIKKHPDIRLHIYGQFLRGKYERGIKKYITLKRLNDKITFYGPADYKTKQVALSNTDIFIFPSYFNEECMPVVVLEAMQAGIPVIASRIGALPEMIEDGINGFLIDPKSVDQLIEKMEVLISNNNLRLQIARKAQQKFQEKYDKSLFDKAIYNLFNKVILEN